MNRTSHPLTSEEFTKLRAAYEPFTQNRLLLTGHSHQAWPLVARAAMTDVFDDAATWVDDKWGQAVFPVIEGVASGILSRMGFGLDDALAFGESSQQLVFRLLSCLDWSERPKIVTTTSEFHSLSRQLRRLQEAGVEVVWVDAQPRAGLADRLIAAIDERTAMVAVSSVIYEDSTIVQGLDRVLLRAIEVGAIPLVDAYHAFNVVPTGWLGNDRAEQAAIRDHVFVTAGGYKYAQFGNGICWLRVPPACTLRPIYTGWFADFASLEHDAEATRSQPVAYGPGAQRFAGSTFASAPFYRARAVLAFFEQHDLSVERLRAISLHQTGVLIEALDRSTDRHKPQLVSSREAAERGGFVTVTVNRADDVTKLLRARRVFVDARGTNLRLGPAPYLSDEELERGVAEVIRAIGKASS